MLCPQCQIPLTASEYLGVKVNSCLQCDGKWLTSESLEQIIVQSKLTETGGEASINSLEDNPAEIVKSSTKKKRKHPHFLSGALDIYD